MELLNLFKSLIVIPEKHGKAAWTYVIDITVLIASYAFFVVLLVALVTLIGFGYVPIEGGGFNNPIGTIAFLWGDGIIVASIPLAAVLTLINLIKVIKAKSKAMWIAFGAYAFILIAVNVGLSFFDLVAMMATWFQF